MYTRAVKRSDFVDTLVFHYYRVHSLGIKHVKGLFLREKHRYQRVLRQLVSKASTNPEHFCDLRYWPVLFSKHLVEPPCIVPVEKLRDIS